MKRRLRAKLTHLQQALAGRRIRDLARRGLGFPKADADTSPDDVDGDSAFGVAAEADASLDDMSGSLVVGGWRIQRRQMYDHVVNTPPDPMSIPSKFLAQFWPGIGSTKASVSTDETEWWALPYGERTVVDALVRHLRPRVAFEFGTFTGSTTLLIADAAPDGAIVHTIDIPAAAFEQAGFTEAFASKGGVPAEMLGSAFRDRDETRTKIEFHRALSEEFDYAPLRGKVDFVFVDASHAYADVLRDSERALEMLSPWGIVVWDDYDWTQPGVVQALNELGARVELCHITSTRLVVHRSRQLELPPDFDDEAIDLVRSVHGLTLTGPERVLALRDAVDYVVRAEIPGAIVECGVYRGGSMLAVVRTLVARGDTGRHLYLFDTFTEMPPAGNRDVDVWGRSGQIWADNANSHPDWWYNEPAVVEDLMVDAGYPREQVHVVPGLVEETVPAAAPAEIALLRLDTDWYESTAHELKHLFPLVVDGGVVIIDDYGFFLGARAAVDEYLASKDMGVLLHRIDETGRALVVRRPSRE